MAPPSPMHSTTSRPFVHTSSSTSLSPPLEHCAPSSHSSADSAFCSPASSSSRPALSSGASSPGEGTSGSFSVVDRSAKVDFSGRSPDSSRNKTDAHKERVSARVQSTPLSFQNARLAMTSASGSASFSSIQPSTHAVEGTGASEQRDADHGGSSRTMAIPSGGSSKAERHASKSRRMSPGGSRILDEESGEQRNGYGRSASDSGSDWQHGVKSTSSNGPQKTDNAEGSASGSWVHLTSDGHEEARRPSAVSPRESHTHVETSNDVRPHLDLANFPPQELLRILAALLQQIATANDQLKPSRGSAGATSGEQDTRRRRQRERNAAPEQALATPLGSMDSIGDAQYSERSEWLSDSHSSLHSISGKPTTAAMGALQTPSSTLCFRARNVPSISIEAYLLRILRYCPASCEVFVSLLVYFDRMSKMGQQSGEQESERTDMDAGASVRRGSVEGSASEHERSRGAAEKSGDGGTTFVGMRGFAIDSFNVHRLVIAGVTVASKFFSDVFYTNSRYAKVGGLPVHELNQLELQFLLLNDFQLMIPLEEMQRYANQLLVYGESSPQQQHVSSSTTALGASERPPSSFTTARAGDAHPGSANTHVKHAGGESVATPDVQTRQQTAALASSSSSQREAPDRAPSSSGTRSDPHGDTTMGDAG